MVLKEFIEQFVMCNSLVKLWNCDEKKRANEKLLICMEWQAKEFEMLKDIPVIGVTDILCIDDCQEAINIVLDTELKRSDVSEPFKKYEKEYYESRSKCACTVY